MLRNTENFPGLGLLLSASSAPIEVFLRSLHEPFTREALSVEKGIQCCSKYARKQKRFTRSLSKCRKEWSMSLQFSVVLCFWSLSIVWSHALEFSLSSAQANSPALLPLCHSLLHTCSAWTALTSKIAFISCSAYTDRCHPFLFAERVSP